MKHYVELENWSCFVTGLIGEKMELFADVSGFIDAQSDDFYVSEIKLDNVSLQFYPSGDIIVANIKETSLPRFLGCVQIDKVVESAGDAMIEKHFQTDYEVS